MAQPKILHALSARFRAGRDVALRNLIERLALADDSGDPIRILDLGGRPEYWRRVGYEFLDRLGVTVLCLNLEVPRDHFVTDGPVAVTWGDACNTGLPDMSFDLVHSNSVIEHVGDAEAMAAFAREVRRLAPVYYVQTPNFWFPIDPHRFAVPMIHWLPAFLATWIMIALPVCACGRLRSVEAARAYMAHCRMLDRRRLVSLFPDAALRRERLAGLTKSFVVVR